jgi:hypothetical protein
MQSLFAQALESVAAVKIKAAKKPIGIGMEEFIDIVITDNV